MYSAIYQILNWRVSLDKLYENHLVERLPSNQHVMCRTWKNKVKPVKNSKKKNIKMRKSQVYLSDGSFCWWLQSLRTDDELTNQTKTSKSIKKTKKHSGKIFLPDGEFPLCGSPSLWSPAGELMYGFISILLRASWSFSHQLPSLLSVCECIRLIIPYLCLLIMRQYHSDRCVINHR